MKKKGLLKDWFASQVLLSNLTTSTPGTTGTTGTINIGTTGTINTTSSSAISTASTPPSYLGHGLSTAIGTGHYHKTYDPTYRDLKVRNIMEDILQELSTVFTLSDYDNKQYTFDIEFQSVKSGMEDFEYTMMLVVNILPLKIVGNISPKRTVLIRHNYIQNTTEDIHDAHTKLVTKILKDLIGTSLVSLLKTMCKDEDIVGT